MQRVRSMLLRTTTVLPITIKTVVGLIIIMISMPTIVSERYGYEPVGEVLVTSGVYEGVSEVHAIRH